jgi:peptidoglycan/xylan/chitin deacetylase (PgdA/CDA1 family)
MAVIMPPQVLKTALMAVALAALAACAGAERAAAPAGVPIRFVLSFDDGPAPSTAKVLDALAANPVQPGVKAIFFVQTRVAGVEGRAMMRRTHAEGHLLAVHTGTEQGHVSHMALSREELEASLRQARADIADIAGVAPRFVRPPFWFYDDEALACYARVQLAMLLTDINARDGVVLGVNLVPGKRLLIRAQLERIKREWQEGAPQPVLDGAAPVIATFHDVNTSTAGNLTEYLQLLVEEARAAGLTLDRRPFYDRRDDLERAAGLRARQL